MNKKTVTLTESDLKNIIKKSVNKILKENQTEKIINRLNNVCEETENNRISLHIENLDTNYITQKFGSRFNQKVFKNENGKIDYVAKYDMDNNRCYLGYIDFGGYSFLFNYLCDLTPEEFYFFFKNFSYNGSRWRQDNSVRS